MSPAWRSGVMPRTVIRHDGLISLAFLRLFSLHYLQSRCVESINISCAMRLG